MRKTTTCLCIDLNAANRKNLDSDVLFLRTLLRSLSDKFRKITAIEGDAGNIEERLLNYMRNITPHGELKGIEDALYSLRCSRRQLQRILKKLTDENKIEKIGKGHYRLIGY